MDLDVEVGDGGIIQRADETKEQNKKNMTYNTQIIHEYKKSVRNINATTPFRSPNTPIITWAEMTAAMWQ